MRKLLLIIVMFLLSFTVLGCKNTYVTTTQTTTLSSTQTTTETEFLNPYYDELNNRIDGMNLFGSDMLTISLQTQTFTNIQEFNSLTVHSIFQVDNLEDTLYTEMFTMDRSISTRSYLSVIEGEYVNHTVQDLDGLLYTNNLGDFQTPGESILEYYGNDILTDFFLFDDILVSKITENIYTTVIPLNKIAREYTFMLAGNLPDLSFILAEFEGLYLTVTYSLVDEYELRINFNFDTIAYEDYGLNVSMKLDINQVYMTNPNANKLTIDTSQLVIMPSNLIDVDNYCFFGSINNSLGLSFNQKTSYFKVYLEPGIYNLVLTSDYLSEIDYTLLDSNYLDFTDLMNFEVLNEGYYFLKFVNNHTSELVIDVSLNKE